MTKWFTQENQIIKGPFGTQEIKLMISGFQDPQKTFIWSRGNSEWIAAHRWQPIDHVTDEIYTPPESFQVINTSIAQPENTSLKNSTPSAVEDFFSNDDEKTFSGPAPALSLTNETRNQSENYSEKYKVQLNFIDQLPMTRDELMSFAGRVDDPSQIAIFDVATKEWKEIYSFKDIVDRLGLTRRKHPRVPILAQFTGSTSRHDQLSARLVTISIGGFGLTDIFDLKIGDKIYGQITSPHFYSPVAIEAEATYCGNDGYVGLKFTQINDDSQSLVTDYVKRFSQST
jgi:hypothetical protein